MIMCVSELTPNLNAPNLTRALGMRRSHKRVGALSAEPDPTPTTAQAPQHALLAMQGHILPGSPRNAPFVLRGVSVRAVKLVAHPACQVHLLPMQDRLPAKPVQRGQCLVAQVNRVAKSAPQEPTSPLRVKLAAFRARPDFMPKRLVHFRVLRALLPIFP
jgi:hypothetical protein